MKKFVLTFILSLGALSAYAAADRAESAESKTTDLKTADAKAETEEAVPVLELKHKSTFALEENSRNPFWPIGWKPAAKLTASTSDTVGPDILPSSFLVSSITVDTGGKFAIINGRAMTEGQVFGLQLGNQTYQITVKAIQDGQVILLRRDQEIAVPLRRR
ncbi:MAG: hypothetical protein ABIR71_00185 [Chthoniobacterales bacterium]